MVFFMMKNLIVWGCLFNLKNMKTTKMSHLYRFDFDKGVPIENFNDEQIINYKWRKGIKTIFAYCLQNAIEKFTLPLIKKFGNSIKLNVIKCFMSENGRDWKEIDLKTVYFNAFLVGCFEREKNPSK